MIAKIKNALKGVLAAIRAAFEGAFTLLTSDDMQLILNGITVVVSAGLWTWGLVFLATGGASILALLGWAFLGGIATSVLASIAVRVIALTLVVSCALAYGLYVAISNSQEVQNVS